MSYFQLLKDDITTEANNVSNLNLLTAGNVPEECDCLVITTLKEDIGHKIVVSDSTDVPPNEKPGVLGRPVLFIRSNLGEAPDYVVG